MLERLLQWDKETLIYLNNLGEEGFDSFWVLATDITNSIPFYILFGLLIGITHNRKQALYKIVSLITLIMVILLLTHLVKESVMRLRPNNEPALEGMIRVLRDPESYSFFSGHAATSFGMVTLLVLFVRKKLKWVWLFYIWAAVFAYSRIYVGVHYLLDIICGLGFGLLMAFLFYRIYNRFIAPDSA
ncbi:phosphatase PAP2 family protein [Poritiphilus flavus]|uniref:Phosphatase PAP2 family protein n=1 Tax=Poritiphilus flavus TaxID=2697053 RepID=A0A6L9EHG3_9FLAO|nr:phosphatase PAP2 family protein [Poritiphilus flavus]NAS14125.1 phosphatase PAP2 family protein [Poritiphilus flavus]